jgi:hypothetical protein
MQREGEGGNGMQVETAPARRFPEHFLMTPNNTQCWQLGQRQRSSLELLAEHILPIKEGKTTFIPFARCF